MAKLNAKDRFIKFIGELNEIHKIETIDIRTWTDGFSWSEFNVRFATGGGVDILHFQTVSKPKHTVLLNIKNARACATHLGVRKQINLLEVVDRTDTFTLKNSEFNSYCKPKIEELGIEFRFSDGTREESNTVLEYDCEDDEDMEDD